MTATPLDNSDGESRRPKRALASRCFEIALTGDAKAVAQLLEIYRPLLLKLANEQLDPELRQKAAASDLVQNSLIKANVAFSTAKFDSLQDVVSWLRVILTNEIATAHRRFRKAKKRDARRERSIGSVHSRRWLDILSLRSTTDSGLTLSRQEECVEVRLAFDSLPAHYRQVIEWALVDDRSFPELASKLGRRADAVRMLFNRAMERLKSELKKRGQRPAQ